MESRHCGQDKRIFFCPVHNASTPCSLQAFGIRCIRIIAVLGILVKLYLSGFLFIVILIDIRLQFKNQNFFQCTLDISRCVNILKFNYYLLFLFNN